MDTTPSPSPSPSPGVAPSPHNASQSSSSMAPSTVPPLGLAPKSTDNTEPATFSTAATARPPTRPRAGRRNTYTSEQDVAIVREVAATGAHVAGFGETRKRYEQAATLLNDNPLFQSKISWKQVQDRYKRLQEQFNSHDNENQRLSGVGGGEMGELADLLMTMREARDDLNAKKTAEEDERKREDEEKEEAGRRLVAASTSRSRSATESETIDVEDENGSSQSARKKRRTVSPVAPDSEMEAFGVQMKEAELARVGVEKERLQLDRLRFTTETEERKQDRIERREERLNDREEREREREADRKERKEEREANSKLEVEKFKLMLGAIAEKLAK